MLKRIKTEDERYQIIRSTIGNVKKSWLHVMASIIDTIQGAYGKSEGDLEFKENQIISRAHLKEIEDIYVKKINTIQSTEDILNIEGFREVLYVWNYLDEDGVKRYLQELFEKEKDKLRFICAMAGKWQGIDEGGWEFSIENYSPYILKEEIYNSIMRWDKRKIDEFDDTEQIKLATFVLECDSNRNNYHIKEAEAQELLKKWKSVENK